MHVKPKLRGSSDIRWKSTANKLELTQQQQDCKADGSGRRLAGREQKTGRRRVAELKLARIEMGGKGMGGRCNDRAFYLPPDQSIASSNGKGTGSQKGERLRASRLMRIRNEKENVHVWSKFYEIFL